MRRSTDLDGFVIGESSCYSMAMNMSVSELFSDTSGWGSMTQRYPHDFGQLRTPSFTRIHIYIYRSIMIYKYMVIYSSK